MGFEPRFEASSPGEDGWPPGLDIMPIIPGDMPPIPACGRVMFCGICEQDTC